MATTPLDDVIMEHISFLKEQIRPENKPQVNDTFRLQIEILQATPTDDNSEKISKSIIMRKAHLKQCTNIKEADRLFAELEALEWLERQIKAYYYHHQFRNQP